MNFFPTRDIALRLGPFSIHWYGIMYAIGFLVGLFLIRRLMNKRNLALEEQDRESLLLHVFFGVILGGRLGYVLFYDLNQYLARPLEILKVWQGGMSSHGGFLGVTIALVLFCQKKKIDFFALTDVLTVPIAFGLALGRMGNFINQELYGTITTLPWGIKFAHVDGYRHPTQLYAVMKDLTLMGLCFAHLHSTSSKKEAGVTTSMLLIGYSVLRFIIEYFREQPHGFISLSIVSVSYGQLYTLPIFLLGALIYWKRKTKE